MASAGTVTGSITITALFQEYITSGVIDPEVLQEALYALGASTGTLNFTNGTGSLEVDTLYAKPLALSGATTTVDFTSVTDPGGASVTFARGRLFFVYNTATTAGYDVKVEAGSSNGWAALPPSSSPLYARNNGGFVIICDPVSTGSGNGNVITSTSKTVTFDPGSNTVTILVMMVGGSAA